MINLKIRYALPEDMFQVVLIKNIAWVYAYRGIMSDEFLLCRTNAVQMQRTIEKWKNALSDCAENKIFLVAENDEDEIVGFVFGGDVSQPILSSDKELHALYVHPAMHGCGVGKALMKSFAERISRQGAKTFSVGCLSENKSLAFYQHMGGQILCEINNSHFENLSETFFIYHVEDILNKE